MLIIQAPQYVINSTIQLSGSKSISNRLLILKEVLEIELDLINISNSEDTIVLQNALKKIKNKNDVIINIRHAGTDMRFLTALLSIKEGDWILTGSERMKQRPIGELVNALRALGADITYLERENYPPLKIKGKKLLGGKIQIDGSVSSQFISALLLISPSFENGLELSIMNSIVSEPYISMTLNLLGQFGIKISSILNTIKIEASSLPPHESLPYTIESDWSAASYWYGLVALTKNAVITLKGLSKSSLQGDSVLPEIYKNFGVSTQFNNDELILTNNATICKTFDYDFTNCPDVAQTVAVTCFGLGIKAQLTGLKTLKIKETDRILALKTELQKFGAIVKFTESSIQINHEHRTRELKHLKDQNVELKTYNDHRMAMSFIPLSLICKQITIDDPNVVNKSYPSYWIDLRKVGFILLYTEIDKINID